MDIYLTRRDLFRNGLIQLHEVPKDTENSCPICMEVLVNIVPSSSDSAKTGNNTAHNDLGSDSKIAGTSATDTTEDDVANTGPTQFGILWACGHIFHTECLRKWLSRKRNCPICRKQLFHLHDGRSSRRTPTANVENRSIWRRLTSNRITSTTVVVGVALASAGFEDLAVFSLVLAGAIASFNRLLRR